ncbi:MAG: hypothetical protein MZV64_49095 [Ignavibacteriales bacterium]|nr:hypothetical protein [Ignavibacteriales bacterium]
MPMNDVLKIHDTTIGEGDRVPGCSMNPDEKLRIARQIERLRVNFIDAGEPHGVARGFRGGPAHCRKHRAYRG